MGLDPSKDLEVNSLQERSKGYKSGKEEKEISQQEKEALKEVFGTLMRSEPSDVKSSIDSLIKRYTSTSSASSSRSTSMEKGLIKLVLQLNDQYPGDIGILCTFMLNVVGLDKGEAVFLKADEPHAYISGGESRRSASCVCFVFSMSARTHGGKMADLRVNVYRYHRVYGYIR